MRAGPLFRFFGGYRELLLNSHGYQLGLEVLLTHFHYDLCVYQQQKLWQYCKGLSESWPLADAIHKKKSCAGSVYFDINCSFFRSV